MPQKILRSEARKKGLKRYFTAIPCKHLHVSERNVATGHCLMCARRKDKVRRDRMDPQKKSDSLRNRQYRMRYGIGLEERNAMADAQEHRCKCCGTPETALMIDHDHQTGTVRGLLCINCNSMLGYALDNPKRLELGIKYLEGS